MMTHQNQTHDAMHVMFKRIQNQTQANFETLNKKLGQNPSRAIETLALHIAGVTALNTELAELTTEICARLTVLEEEVRQLKRAKLKG